MLTEELKPPPREEGSILRSAVKAHASQVLVWLHVLFAGEHVLEATGPDALHLLVHFAAGSHSLVSTAWGPHFTLKGQFSFSDKF